MLAGAVAVAAIEHHPLVQDDGLDEAVLLEVVDELAELGAIDLHEREQGGGWVELKLGGSSRRCPHLGLGGGW